MIIKKNLWNRVKLPSDELYTYMQYTINEYKSSAFRIDFELSFFLLLKVSMDGMYVCNVVSHFPVH